MPKGHIDAETKLENLGKRLRKAATELHPTSRRDLERIFQALRQQHARELEGREQDRDRSH